MHFSLRTRSGKRNRTKPNLICPDMPCNLICPELSVGNSKYNALILSYGMFIQFLKVDIMLLLSTSISVLPNEQNVRVIYSDLHFTAIQTSWAEQGHTRDQLLVLILKLYYFPSLIKIRLIYNSNVN